MYSSYDEASGSIVSELEKVVNLPPFKRAYLRSVVARALKVDTNHSLHRTDFLTPERISRALQNQMDDLPILVTIRTLFPRTWKVVENCK